MFQLTDNDKEILANQNVVQRLQVSEKDPYMQPKQDWKPMHQPIASTEELMESLEPYDSRKLSNLEAVDRFRDQEKRYYKSRDEI